MQAPFDLNLTHIKANHDARKLVAMSDAAHMLNETKASLKTEDSGFRLIGAIWVTLKEKVSGKPVRSTV